VADAAAPAPEKEAAETPAPAAPAKRAPFALRHGARVELGPKKGKVKIVRGTGDVPYDVQIRWDGEKYPEWHVYRTLQLHFDAGRFKIL
jgi:hypothetical protein